MIEREPSRTRLERLLRQRHVTLEETETLDQLIDDLRRLVIAYCPLCSVRT